MMCSIVALTIGHNQGMGNVEYGEIYDIYFLPAYLRRLDGSSCSVVGMRWIWCAMLCSIMTLAIGHNQGMVDVEHGRIYAIYVLPVHLRLFHGPSCSWGGGSKIPPWLKRKERS